MILINKTCSKLNYKKFVKIVTIAENNISIITNK